MHLQYYNLSESQKEIVNKLNNNEVSRSSLVSMLLGRVISYKVSISPTPIKDKETYFRLNKSIIMSHVTQLQELFYLNIKEVCEYAETFISRRHDVMHSNKPPILKVIKHEHKSIISLDETERLSVSEVKELHDNLTDANLITRLFTEILDDESEVDNEEING